MKELVAELILKSAKSLNLKLKKEEIITLIEIPPSAEMGDYAFPCFFLAGLLKMAPEEIAVEVRKNIKKIPEQFEDIQSQGAYVNFFLDRKEMAKSLILKILEEKENYGKTDIGKGKIIVVEFSSVNIAKPFGIGHLRSTIIGNSLSRISEFEGYKIIRMNYLGDWGTQFGKMILGYKKFGNARKLNSKNAIKHMLEIYIKANKKQYEEKARQEFQELEKGNKENLMLWKKFKEASLKNFEKIYRVLGIKFDVYSAESEYNDSLIAIIDELLKKKIIKESEGALIADLEEFGLSTAIIEKSDGATIYLTRDIAAAVDRFKKYHFEKMVYEVGQEQILHFRQLFKLLELLGYDWSKNCIHVSHGLYLDKDGKKFATRKGKTIFMEDVLDETMDLAKKEIKKRYPKISKIELEKRALKVAIAAIFYGDLKNNRSNNIMFDIKRFVSFDGDTGPYLQYSYARANSIIKKAKTNKRNISISDLDNKEIELIKKFSQFPEIAKKSFTQLNPSFIANYSYQLSKIFNEFYHECPVIGSEKEQFRLLLVASFQQILKNCLFLLGIEPLEKM